MPVLKDALAAAAKRGELLRNELVLVRTERYLLKERLKKFMRKIFCAKSEVSSQSQKDMFFNEAEGLGAQVQPTAQEEDSEDPGIDVPAPRAPNVGANHWILPCHAMWCAMNCLSLSVPAPMIALP
jgi:hypothetical protein